MTVTYRNWKDAKAIKVGQIISYFVDTVYQNNLYGLVNKLLSISNISITKESRKERRRPKYTLQVYFV